MASPGKRRRKKMNGGYGILNKPEVVKEMPEVAPAPVEEAEASPAPKKKEEKIFSEGLINEI